MVNSSFRDLVEVGGAVMTTKRGEERGDKPFEDGHVEGELGVGDESAQVGFTDTADRVDIRTRAIILCEVPSQTRFIYEEVHVHVIIPSRTMTKKK